MLQSTSLVITAQIKFDGRAPAAFRNERRPHKHRETNLATDDSLFKCRSRRMTRPAKRSEVGDRRPTHTPTLRNRQYKWSTKRNELEDCRSTPSLTIRRRQRTPNKANLIWLPTTDAFLTLQSRRRTYPAKRSKLGGRGDRHFPLPSVREGTIKA